MKRIVRIFSILFLVFLLLVMGFGFWAYQHKDEAVKIVAEDLQQHLKPQITVESYGLEPFRNFPYMSLAFAGVKVFHQKDTLAKIQNMYFTFSLMDLVDKKYKIIQLYLENSTLHLKTDAKGNHNFDILKSSKNTNSDNGINFELRGMTFKNVQVNYENQSKRQKFDVKLQNITSSYGFLDNDMSVEIEGNIFVKQAKLDGNGYFDNKTVFLDLEFMYWDNEKKWLLSRSEIAPEQARFVVEGEYFTDTNYANFKAEGLPTHLQTLLALAPKEILEKYKNYQSHGKVNFQALVQGKFSATSFPKIDITFGFENASFYHPDSERTIDSLFIDGKFTNGNQQNAFSSELKIDKIVGKIDKQPFKGSFCFTNFNYPTLQLQAECNVNLADVLEIYPIPEIKSVQGSAQLALRFDGKLEEIKRNPNTSKIQTSGKLYLRNVQLQPSNLSLPIEDLNGSFEFKNNHTETADFSGRIGQSDFRLEGDLEHFMTWLFSDDYPLRIRTKLKSNKLYFNELLALSNYEESSSEPYKVVIPKNIVSNLILEIDSAKFGRFEAQNLRGQVWLKKQALKLDSLKMDIFGGSLSLSGTADASEVGKIKIVTENKAKNMNLKTLFYAFENFGQDFVQDRHISGNLDADWETLFYTDVYLNPDDSKFRTDIRATVRDGKLIGFEPFKELSKLFQNNDIQEVSFSEMTHEFHVQNQELTFSKLKINSSLGVLYVAGTHDFEQRIDYRLQIPLNNFKKPKKDYPPHSVAQNSEGKTNLFLKVIGTTDTFKVRYDTQATWQKIKISLHEKIVQFQDLFRKRKQEEQQDLNDAFFQD